VEQEKVDEENLVAKKLKRLACDELVKEGKSLKHIKCEDFEK
jgi:hypothetical protein